MKPTSVIVPVVGGSNIEGNVGTCRVVSTEAHYDYFHRVTVLTNSCNGSVVMQNVYLDGDAIGSLLGGLLLIPVIIGVIAWVFAVARS